MAVGVRSREAHHTFVDNPGVSHALPPGSTSDSSCFFAVGTVGPVTAKTRLPLAHSVEATDDSIVRRVVVVDTTVDAPPDIARIEAEPIADTATQPTETIAGKPTHSGPTDTLGQRPMWKSCESVSMTIDVLRE